MDRFQNVAHTVKSANRAAKKHKDPLPTVINRFALTHRKSSMFVKDLNEGIDNDDDASDGNIDVIPRPEVIQEGGKAYGGDDTEHHVDSEDDQGDDLIGHNPRAELALRQGALFGDMTQIRSALAAGASVDACDQFGNTALLLASSRGRINCIRALLKAGADIDWQPRTSNEISKSNDRNLSNTSNVKLIEADSNGAHSNGRRDAGSVGGGGTCLHMAARWGKAKAAEELLRRGADAAAIDSLGRTAADLARSAIACDPERHSSVHPPARDQGPNRDREEDEEEDDSMRLRAEEKARAAAAYAKGLTPHEQTLAVLEDWEAMAEEALAQEKAAEEAAAAAAAAAEGEDEDAAAARALKHRIASITLEIDRSAEAAGVAEAAEAEALETAKTLAEAIKVLEARLEEKRDKLEEAQRNAVSSSNEGRLARFDAAAARLSRLEKQVEVARLEGRPDLREALSLQLEGLRASKRKAQRTCKNLLKERKRKQKKAVVQRKSSAASLLPSLQQQLNGSMSPRSMSSSASLLSLSLTLDINDDTASAPGSRPLSPSSLHQDSRVSSPGGDQSMLGIDGEDATCSEADALEVFEVPDRFDGLVPGYLSLNDDAWKAMDLLQDRIDRLRNQIRFLGSKPHC